MVTAHQIASGLQFPLTALDRDVLNFYKIAPGQVNGKFWRIMRAFNHINSTGKYTLSLDDVRQTYYLRFSDEKVGVKYWHFVRRAGRNSIIEKIVESDKPWADYPLIVGGDFGGKGKEIPNSLKYWKFNFTSKSFFYLLSSHSIRYPFLQ
ncbi:hypothetical protein FRX31_028221 [Thalictrum thalictroides]|uniref:Uncharacterized protein n=1 Tax=Thalictrum thalictroides TaxID=46969 RepID=A0A7J6VCW8_THATH|nr:hypothetical protein FRX31_028221 [Thalictrum thalictroides]